MAQKPKPKPPIPGNWSLVLDENFDSFDKTLWSTSLESSKLTYRNSKCFFLENNVLTKNGNLMLITKKEKLELKDSNGEIRKLNFSSGMIHSFRKFKQKYGYFEARMKLPEPRGLWPAFWMMPDRSFDNITSFTKGMRSTKILNDSAVIMPGKGMEIDIMEYLTEWDKKKFHYAAHWDGYGDALKSHHGYYSGKTNANAGYHKFALYWTKDLLVWYIDDKEIARLKSERVADVPMYLIFSTNVGGWATWRVETDKLPAYTLIDYVRVWQKV